MRLHSLLLYLYPASFRFEYGAELSHVFAERRRLATNPLSILFLWLGELLDILFNAAHVHWDIFRQDMRYSVRSLRRTPGFTLTAIIVTGLGIGANTAVFSLTDRALLHPLPFPDPGTLVQLWERTPAYPRVEVSPPNFIDWRKMSVSFEGMAAYTSITANFLSNAEPKQLAGSVVSSDFFPVLGVHPALGRSFTVADSREDAPQTLLISHGLWQGTFGGAADILGKSVRLDEDLYTVVGVMPADFYFPSRGTQFWIPMVIGDSITQTRDNLYLRVLGRVKRGVRIQQAEAEMTVIGDQLARQYPKENDKTGILIEMLGDLVPSQTRLLIWTLFGASLCVLLIACTNLANLLLARAMARRKELMVRAAIGAGRERLVRQLLTESVVLAFAGGVVGVGVAITALPLLTVLIPTTLPLGDATVLDPRVFGFAALVTLGTGLGFGVLPALRMCSGVNIDGLREGSRSGVGGRRERLRSVLVMAEITASVVLLISAGLLIRALWRVQAVNPGFRPDSVLTMQTSLPMPRYSLMAPRAAFYMEILSSVRSLSGVSNAAFISSLPMIPGGGGIWPVAIPGASIEAADPGGTNTVSMRMVTPDYFATMGIPLHAGRDIDESDNINAAPVIVVSESFANQYWPGLDPLGRSFHFAINSFPYALQDRTVVGVVGDVRFRGLERSSEPQVYLASGQIPDNTMSNYAPKELVVRSSGDTGALVPLIRSFIRKADPELPISAVRTLREIVDNQTVPRATQIRLVVSFAGLALLLAGIGIHGLLSFAVGQRSSEFGLRIALGAQSRDILSMVLRDGLILAGTGTILGLILAYYAGRSMEALLAGVPPSDPLTLAVAGIVAFAMTLSGSLMPALKAMRTDPTTVIRGE